MTAPAKIRCTWDAEISDWVPRQIRDWPHWLTIKDIWSYYRATYGWDDAVRACWREMVTHRQKIKAAQERAELAHAESECRRIIEQRRRAHAAYMAAIDEINRQANAQALASLRKRLIRLLYAACNDWDAVQSTLQARRDHAAKEAADIAARVEARRQQAAKAEADRQAAINGKEAARLREVMAQQRFQRIAETRRTEHQEHQTWHLGVWVRPDPPLPPVVDPVCPPRGPLSTMNVADDFHILTEDADHALWEETSTPRFAPPLWQQAMELTADHAQRSRQGRRYRWTPPASDR